MEWKGRKGGGDWEGRERKMREKIKLKKKQSLKSRIKLIKMGHIIKKL